MKRITRCAKAIVRGLLASWSVVCSAEPALVYERGLEGGVEDVRALVGIEEPMAAPGENCDQRIAELVVDEVVYDGVSNMVAGFRATKPAPNEWYGIFRLDNAAVYKALPNSAHGDMLRLFKKGNELIVVYQVCGSGGFVSVRDVYKKSTLNNP